MESIHAKDYLILEDRDTLIEILDQIEEGVFWIDFSGKIIKVNRAAVLKTGYSRSELCTMQIFQLVSDLTVSSWYVHVNQLQKRKKANFKHMLTTRSGKSLPVSVKTHVIENGGASLVCAVVRDNRKLKEERLNFQRVFYEYDKLIYRLSHDLRSPISTILGLVNLTKKDCTNDQTEYLQLMEDTLRKQNQLMMDVHHLSTIHTSPIQNDDINLSDLINDIVGNIPAEKGTMNTRCSYRFKLTRPFYSDYYLVTKVLSPIILNAFQYSRTTDRKAKVRIAVTTNAKGAQIVVKDNGSGIDAIIRDKVFEMFFRGSSHSNGSGLGLYIAKVAAEKLQATIRFKTSKEGTTFVVSLPHS